MSCHIVNYSNGRDVDAPISRDVHFSFKGWAFVLADFAVMKSRRSNRLPGILCYFRDFPESSLVRHACWIVGIAAYPTNGKDGWAADKHGPRFKVAKIRHTGAYVYAS